MTLLSEIARRKVIDWTSYSGLTLHRKCPQAWSYRYLFSLSRPIKDDAKPELHFGNWFHALRAAEAIDRGRRLGSLKHAPKRIRTTDEGPKIETFEHDGRPDCKAEEGRCRDESHHFPVENLVSQIWEAIEEWEETIPEEHVAEWASKLGSPSPSRLLRSLETRYQRQYKDETVNEQPIAVEVKWTRQLPGQDTTLLGYTDEVYFDVKRNLTVVRDHKGLALNTPLPTPQGWTTMGEIQEGDFLLGSDGKAAQVMAKSEVHYNPCYRVTFEDGASVIADHEHRWVVSESRSGRKHVMTTEEVRDNLWTKHKRAQRHLYIEATALSLPDKDLPLDPYVLGAWVGDGTRRTGRVTNYLPGLWEEIKRRGFDVAPHRTGTRTIYGLRTVLRFMGLLDEDKMIPQEYLRASHAQRLDLLRGIMDTDGSWNKARSRAVIQTTDKALAGQYRELIVSLGWRCAVIPYTAKGFGLVKAAWSVCFTPDEQPFLARPEVSIKKRSVKSGRRLVWSVEPVMTVPTQCVSVDSFDHTYLWGEQMIATHNTTKTLSTYGSSADDLLDSQLDLNAWGLADNVEKWGCRPVEAVAFNRVNSVKPTTPKLVKSGRLSKTVSNFDLMTYLAFCKSPAAVEAGYEPEQSQVERITSPSYQTRFFQRTLRPISRNIIRAHLQAAVDSNADSSLTMQRVEKRGEGPRNMTGSACRFCDFAKLCRAQMVGGVEGEYEIAEYGLRHRESEKALAEVVQESGKVDA